MKFFPDDLWGISSGDTKDGRNSFVVLREGPPVKWQPEDKKRESVTSHTVTIQWLQGKFLYPCQCGIFLLAVKKSWKKICKAITSNLKKLGEGDYSHALNSNLLIYFTLRRRNISKNSFPYFQKSLYIYFKCLRDLILHPQHKHCIKNSFKTILLVQVCSTWSLLHIPQFSAMVLTKIDTK